MSTFSIPLATLAEKMQADVELVARKITADAFGSVVRKTPVKTGRARANWNVSHGTPDVSTSASVNQERGTNQAARGLALPLGGVNYIANGLPYIDKLEHGSSVQAPAGMVRVTVAEVGAFVRKAIER